MSSPPLIGITCGKVLGDGEPAFGQNQAYVRAVQQAGGCVVLIPPANEQPAERLIERLDGLLLSGGADIDPARYGEPPSPALGRLDLARDAAEVASFRVARQLGRPILGICRGQQLINVACGGSLHQDMVVDLGHDFDHHSESDLGRQHEQHAINLRPASLLARVTGHTRLSVNSFHHQAVKKVGSGLRVSATSPDGIVEGLETEDGKLLAVQCHPEELTSQPWAEALFRAFVQAAVRGSYD